VLLDSLAIVKRRMASANRCRAVQRQKPVSDRLSIYWLDRVVLGYVFLKHPVESCSETLWGEFGIIIFHSIKEHVSASGAHTGDISSEFVNLAQNGLGRHGEVRRRERST
jgi:hypothetical protein